ncbi:MAG: hypothetical protein RL532_1145 [Actinomycetota bacterium]
MLHIKPGTAWADFYARAKAAAPEAFDAQSLRNLTRRFRVHR